MAKNQSYTVYAYYHGYLTATISAPNLKEAMEKAQALEHTDFVETHEIPIDHKFSISGIVQDTDEVKN